MHFWFLNEIHRQCRQALASSNTFIWRTKMPSLDITELLNCWFYLDYTYSKVAIIYSFTLFILIYSLCLYLIKNMFSPEVGLDNLSNKYLVQLFNETLHLKSLFMPVWIMYTVLDALLLNALQFCITSPQM